MYRVYTDEGDTLCEFGDLGTTIRNLLGEKRSLTIIIEREDDIGDLRTTIPQYLRDLDHREKQSGLVYREYVKSHVKHRKAYISLQVTTPKGKQLLFQLSEGVGADTSFCVKDTTSQEEPFGAKLESGRYTFINGEGEHINCLTREEAVGKLEINPWREWLKLTETVGVLMKERSALILNRYNHLLYGMEEGGWVESFPTLSNSHDYYGESIRWSRDYTKDISLSIHLQEENNIYTCIGHTVLREKSQPLWTLIERFYLSGIDTSQPSPLVLTKKRLEALTEERLRKMSNEFSSARSQHTEEE